MTMSIDPSAVVAFWKQAGPAKWFEKDAEFDAAFVDGFRDAHMAAARRELDHFAGSAEGSLALMILLDQFPRNAFRGTAHQFATDPLARMFARRAIEADHDLQTENALRRFFWLPFQHSEDRSDQDWQVERVPDRTEREPDDRWAEHHREIIVRFGRFPHRNRLLGRDTTDEEQAWLEEDGFKG